jgi:hypothetical protein
MSMRCAIKRNVCQRREPRYDCEIPAHVRILTVPGFDNWPDTEEDVTITNISRSCLRLSLASTELPEGTELDIRCRPGGLWRSLRLSGTLFRTTRHPDAKLPLIVVNLEPSSPRQLARWHRFIERKYDRRIEPQPME